MLRKTFGQRCAVPPARGAVLVLAILAVICAGATAAAAQDAGPNRAGLVVVHGGGQVVKRCVEFSETQITGLELLQRAGMDLSLDDSNPLGVAVCRLEGEGCGFPQEACFCQCQGSPCVYWSYWQGTDGNGWQYSTNSAAMRSLGNGDVDGWYWGASDFGAGSPLPPVAFDEICLPPSATPTATATHRPPTATPLPEPTDPPPTVTPPPTPTDASPPPTNTPEPPQPALTPPPPLSETRTPFPIAEGAAVVATPTPPGSAGVTVITAAPTTGVAPAATPAGKATAMPSPSAAPDAGSAASVTPRPARTGPPSTPLLAGGPAPAPARRDDARRSPLRGILVAAGIALGGAAACGMALVAAKRPR
jgi:hypothetical protein